MMLVVRVVVVVAMAVFGVGIGRCIILLVGIVLLWRIGFGGEVGRSFDDFVQFAPIEPHTTALGAIIDFHTLAVGHHQGNVAVGTVHGGGVGGLREQQVFGKKYTGFVLKICSSHQCTATAMRESAVP